MGEHRSTASLSAEFTKRSQETRCPSDSAFREFPRSVPMVTSFRCLKIKIAEGGHCAPSYTSRHGVGCPAWWNFPYSFPSRAGENGCLFFLLLQADRLCSQEPCQLWSASSLADGSLGTQAESSAICTFLGLRPSASTANLLGTHSPQPWICSLPVRPVCLLPTPKQPASASSRDSPKGRAEKTPTCHLVQPSPQFTDEQLEPREGKGRL